MRTNLTKGYDDDLVGKIEKEVQSSSSQVHKKVTSDVVIPGISDMEGFYTSLLQPQGVENIVYLSPDGENRSRATKTWRAFLKDTELVELPKILDSITQGGFSVKYTNGEVVTFNFNDDTITLTGRYLPKATKEEKGGYFAELLAYARIVNDGVLTGSFEKSDVEKKERALESTRKSGEITTYGNVRSIGSLYETAVVPQLNLGTPFCPSPAYEKTIKKIILTELPEELAKHKEKDIAAVYRNREAKIEIIRGIVNSATKVEIIYSNGEVIELSNRVLCDHYYKKGTTDLITDRLAELVSPTEIPEIEVGNTREGVETHYSNLYDIYTEKIKKQVGDDKVTGMVAGSPQKGFKKYEKMNLLQLENDKLENVLENVSWVIVSYNNGEIALIRSPPVKISQHIGEKKPNSTARLAEVCLLAERAYK